MCADKFVVTHSRSIGGDLKIIGSIEATFGNKTTESEFTHDIDDDIVEIDLTSSKSNEEIDCYIYSGDSNTQEE